MRIYELRSISEQGTRAHFLGSVVAAKSLRAQMVSEGTPRKLHEIIAHDIPTDKEGLLDWLNKNVPRKP